MSDLIERVRNSIASLGGSEAKAITDNIGLKGLWEDKQALLAEMNKAKREAAELAAQPYLDVLKDLDEQYAFLLRMIGDNK